MDNIICQICNIETKNLKNLSGHISKHKISSQEYYDIYLKGPTENKCYICSGNTTFEGMTRGYLKFCSKKCNHIHRKIEIDKRNDLYFQNKLENEKINFECKECGWIAFNSSKGVGGHLRKKHNMSAQQYYDKHFKKEDEGKCLGCDKNTKFASIDTGYGKYCNRFCSSKVSLEARIVGLKKKWKTDKNSILEKRYETNMRIYGTKHAFQNDDIIEQIKATNMRNLGVENALSSKKIQEQIKATNLRIYGTEYPMQNEKQKKNCSEKVLKNYEEFGAPINRPGAREKSKQTCQLKYGADHWAQSKIGRETISKNICERIVNGEQPKNKNYKTGYFASIKNNKEVFYRSSYELVAYQILESLSKVAYYVTEPFRIPYIDNEGMTRNYVPDILITYTDNSKELIEVKPKCFLDDEMVILRNRATSEYCSKNDMIFNVWTEKELGLLN